jgi:drug/metabolite transporter (DMT)-like permease
MPKAIKSEVKLYFLLFLLILAWGFNWPISKIALQYMPPLWFTATRLAVGTLTMFPIVIALRKFIWPKKKDIKIILVIGFLQIGIFMSLLNLGLNHVAAGRSSILIYTTPLWVVPISVIFFQERTSLTKWLGFLFGAIGILILFNPLTIDWQNSKVLLGNGFLLLAALSWAIAILCARYMHWPHSPLQLISWQLLVGAIPALILAISKQPHPTIIWNHALILTILYGGMIATAFAYWGTVVISKELSPVTSSLSMLGVPICGVVSSAFILGEVISLPLLLALGFIIVGLLCVILDKPRRKKDVIMPE